MKHRLIIWACSLSMLLMMPLTVLAADEEKQLDAHLANYPETVKVADASPALTWLLLVFLTMLCIGGLFMNAKRTHLD